MGKSKSTEKRESTQGKEVAKKSTKKGMAVNRQGRKEPIVGATTDKR